MSRYKNKEAKKYLLIMIGVTIFSAIVFFGALLFLFQSYRMQENTAISALFEEIQKKYPEVESSDLIKILNEPVQSVEVTNPEIMKAYGLFSDRYYIAAMRRVQNRAILMGLLVLIGVELLLIGCFCGYLKLREKKLQKLNHYMGMVADGKYDLDISNNSEDELSNLQNNLYKLTLTLKEQALQAKDQKEALAESVSDISHQLKTPLTSISILLDNIMESPDMPKELQDKFLQEISRQIFHMNWMVISMLKLSRLDAGVVEFEKQEFALKDVIEEAVNNLDVIAELKGVSVEVCYPDIKENSKQENEICIYGDRNWNREAIMNIIKNAIEHSDSLKDVIVKVEDNSVYTAIYITNFGIPISKEDEKQIFERYFSAANSAENSIGIGLPLAKAILEKQNGYLSVESDEESTTFIMKYRKCH